MANIAKMHEFFEIVDLLIQELSADDPAKREMLEHFFFRILCVCDGMEGSDLDWKGIALVAQENLPSGVEEVNDGFLHDVWSERTWTKGQT